MELPESIRDRQLVHASFFLINSIPHIFAITALGQVIVVSIEGEEEFKKSLFSSMEEHYPVTSCSIYHIHDEQEILDCVITTLGHGLYHVSIDMKNDSFTLVQLASPALPVTCLSVLQTETPYHLTQTALQETGIEGKRTLVTVLSDNSVVAYDLTANTRNFEYSILTWLMPLQCIRDMTVMNNILFNSEHDVIMMSTRDHIAVFKMKQEMKEVEFSEKVKQRLLHDPFDYFTRLLQ